MKTPQSASVMQFLLLVLFVISPFYLVPSIGGAGFDLPFNITVWMAATVAITYQLWFLSSQPRIILPNGYLYLLLLPAGILLSAVIAGVVDPIVWLFRIVYIFAGVMFLFGLFQFKTLNTDKVLFYIVIAGGVFSLHGIIEIHHLEDWIGAWLPRKDSSLPTSVFQQVNVLASYLATSILIAVYLLLSAKRSRVVSALLLVTIFAASYTVVLSASRVGLLSLVVGLVALLIGHSWQQVKQHKAVLISIVVIMLIAGFLGQAGFQKTMDKTYRLAAPEHAEQRYAIYQVSLEAIKQSPIVGHGIGSFWQSWYEAAVPWWQQHQDVRILNRLTHPHNELLMWTVEGGLIALLSIVISLIVVAMKISQQHKKRALIFFALLFPISFHAMVELPFYHSVLHWFVWLFLLFFALTKGANDHQQNLSQAARLSIKTVSVIMAVTGLAFLYNTALSQQEMVDYANGTATDKPLAHAIGNAYYADDAKRMALRARLAHAIGEQHPEAIDATTQLLEKELMQTFQLKLFADVITGYEALGQHDDACTIARLGLDKNPWNKPLKNYLQKCEN